MAFTFSFMVVYIITRLVVQSLAAPVCKLFSNAKLKSKADSECGMLYKAQVLWVVYKTSEGKESKTIYCDAPLLNLVWLWGKNLFLKNTGFNHF